jgi:hypothetical protein
LKTPEQGAQTSIYLASSPDAQRVSGRYFANRKQKRASKAAYDVEAGRKLWLVSTELAGLDA